MELLQIHTTTVLFYRRTSLLLIRKMNISVMMQRKRKVKTATTTKSREIDDGDLITVHEKLVNKLKKEMT